MPRKKSIPHKEPRVTLKTIAQHLGLTPGTVSAALNDSPAARSIPEHTKERIIAAARELNYRPNYFALTVIHRHDQRVLQAYSQMLLTRGVEGFITTDMSIKQDLGKPTVAVA